MVTKLLIAFGLMASCVAIHAIGVTAALRWLRALPAGEKTFGAWLYIFIRVAGWVVLLHLAEVAIWALVYAWRDAMPDLHSAFYFSGVTYTTTGYGDLVLPSQWRLVGAVEALTGILMCGWSTGFFFAVVGRIHDKELDSTHEPVVARSAGDLGHTVSPP